MEKSTLMRDGTVLGFATPVSLAHIMENHFSMTDFETYDKSVFTVPPHLLCSLIEAGGEIGRIQTDSSFGRSVIKLHVPFPIGISSDGGDARVLNCGFEPDGAFLRLKTAYPLSCFSCKYVVVVVVVVADASKLTGRDCWLKAG